MIKLKDLLPDPNRKVVYHVTSKKNIPSMEQHGIQPKPDKVARFCTRCVCLFDNRTTMEEAIMNWLSDKFPEDEELVCLTIKTDGLDLHEAGVGYEVYSLKPIPWSNVIKIEDI